MIAFCMNSPSRKYIATVLFIALSILIGTLIVYLTSARPSMFSSYEYFQKYSSDISMILLEYICQHSHRLTVTDIKNYRSHPQSVAISHLNSDDNLLDFVVANTGSDTIDIYFGRHNQTFEYYATYSTGFHSQPYSVAVGHLNGHGGIDIAVANFGTNNIVIFAGFDNGSFILSQSLSTGSSRSLTITLADLNNDQQLDIIVLNYGTNSVGIFLALTNKSFQFTTNYPTGYDSLPKSLVIADVNNDHQLDIVVANFGTSNIGLFFGDGNGTFADQVIHSTGSGSNPSSVVTGDVDHDNYLDIIVASYGTHNVKILFGDRNETFVRQMTYSTGMNSHPEFVSVNDINGDDQLDIIAIDSVNEKVYVFSRNDDGTFPLLSTYFADFGSSPISMGSSNFNDDKKSDVLIVNRGANNVLMLMNYSIVLSASYSTFTAKTLNDLRSIAIGDLNSDKVLDIVCVSNYNNWINVFLGYGNGSFALAANISTGVYSGMYHVALRDLNEDDHLDIIVPNFHNNSFSILWGCGNGTFSTIITYPTTTIISPFSFAINDVNHDHCLDIVVVGYSSATVGIYAGDCNGGFQVISIIYLETGSKPNHIAILDFNNDTHMDLVITNAARQPATFHFGDGTGRFPISQSYHTGDLEELEVWYNVALGDFNNDNQTDLAASLMMSDQIRILFGNRNITFANNRTYTLRSCRFPLDIVSDDFNNDGRPDLAVSCKENDDIAMLLGRENGEFWSETVFSIKDVSFPGSLRSGDFNNDGISDIAVADYIGNKVGILMMNYKADFDIQTKYSTGISPQPYAVAATDLNNDHISDVVVVYSGTKRIGIQLGFGNGSFGSETNYPTGPNSLPQHVNVGDFNGDNQIDIVVSDSKSDNIIILLGNGDGTFDKDLTYPMGLQSSPTWVAIDNLNSDNSLDLVVANQGTDNLGVLYGNNYTTFVLHQTYSIGSGSDLTSVAVGDINNDNRLDIALTDYKSKNIIVFFGDGNGSFTNQVIYSAGYGSTPCAIALADMNKDGCLDIVVGNEGTEFIGIMLGNGDGTFGAMFSYFYELASSVFALTVGDINNDDQLDIVVIEYFKGKVDVFLGFGNGSLSLATTYSTGSESKPCSIAMKDLNNDTYLDVVIAYAGEARVDVMKGYGNGSFATQIFPRFREQSGTFSFALGDFNKDDHLDIAVSIQRFGCVEIFFGFGNMSFKESKVYSLGALSSPSNIIAEDLNHDDRLDIIVYISGYDAFVILFGTKDGDFLMGRKLSVNRAPNQRSVVLGDLNDDSHLDFVAINADHFAIDVFLWNGYEPFAMPAIISTGFGSKPRCVAIGDFDHDDQSDLVVANYGTDNIAIMLSIKMYNSANSLIYSTGHGSRPYALTIGHFNDDNRLDVAVINSGTNDVTIFHGLGNGSLLMIASYSTGVGSIPHSIAVADFNNDNLLDLAIANMGANKILLLFGFKNGTFGHDVSYPMRYNSRPYSVAISDFDRDGWMDMAVANFEADYIEILLQPC